MLRSLFPESIAIALVMFAERVLADCPSPFQKYEVGCYHFNGSVSLNWWKAAEYCWKLESFLAAPKTREEADIIRKKLQKDIKKNTWLGGTDQGDEGNWVWQHNYGDMAFTLWTAGEPDNYKQRQNCLLLNWKRDYGWTDDFCHVKAAVVCQKHKWLVKCHEEQPLVVVVNMSRKKRDLREEELQCIDCPPRYTRIANGCYYFSSQMTAHWEEAENICKLISGHLAMIQGPSEQMAIMEHLINGDISSQLYWIGVKKNASGVWVWSKTGSPVTFSPWVRSHPKPIYSCGGLQDKDKWSSVNCQEKHPFICAYGL